MVLGSNSFSGASFCASLLKQGYSVIGMSRSKEPHVNFLPYRWSDSSSFEFCQADINHDLKKIIDRASSSEALTVVNFAAQSMVAQSWENPLDWYKTNTLSTIALHDELRKLKNLKKYVHISTPEVYGTCEGLVKENVNYSPSTPYATSRAAADMSLMNFYKTYDFPVVFTRAANVYGPGQQLYRIIPRTILYILTGQKLQLHGGGHSERSFIHIDDVSKATLQIAQKGQNGDIYHIATNTSISIRDLVYKVCQLMEVDFDDYVEVSGDRLGKDAAYLLATEKMKKEFNWQAEISLDEGIKSCISWVKENLENLLTLPQNYIHKK
jgi:dTDP-glucose 4,6-dehydratase